MRIVPFMMPSTRIIPSPTTLFTVFETPADDEHTSTFIVVHGTQAGRPGRGSSKYSASRIRASGPRMTVFFVRRRRSASGRTAAACRPTGPDSPDSSRRMRSSACPWGAIFDRSIEHLVPADRAREQLAPVAAAGRGTSRERRDVAVARGSYRCGGAPMYSCASRIAPSGAT